MRHAVRWLFMLTGTILTVLAGGCATTVVQTHPLVETAPDATTAKVYFIRPFTYRERGAADNPVKIEVNNAPLLELGKGEYTLVPLKPSAITVTTRNMTRFTNKNELVEMTRSLELDLKPGVTYFMHIRQVNEEFRGVYYLIQPVDLTTAKGLVFDLHPSGAARSARIPDLPER
jgi:hypothetical protein